MKLINESIEKLVKFGSIPVIHIGLFFNIFSFVVFSRARFKKHKIAYYSRINVLTHCFNLLGYLVYYVFLLCDIDIRITSDFMCKYFQFFLRSCVQLSSWIEILITYDRNNSIRWANWFQIKDKKKFNQIIFVCVLIIFILNSPNLAFSLVDASFSSSSSLSNLTRSNETVNRKLCLASSEIHFLRDMLSKVLGIYLPLLVMVYMNVNLFRDLLNSSKNRPHLINLNDQSLMKNKKKSPFFKRELNYGLTIFTLNMLYLLTNLPIAIVMTIITLDLFSSPVIGINEENLKRIYTMNLFSMFLISFFYSSTFFVNFIFNRHFNKEIASIVRNHRIIACCVKKKLITSKIPDSDGSVLYESTAATKQII